LLRVDIDHFRSIKDQWLLANGLVVLFGPNSAGKTSVLEAVAEVITDAGGLRSDPGQVDDEDVMGSVTFALPKAGTAGTDDARTFASLLSGEQAGPSLFGESTYPWPWLAEELRASLLKAKAHGARAILAAALAGAGPAGTARDRMLLARAVFNPGLVFFSADAVSISMSVYRPLIPAAAIRAAGRIAAVPDGNDPLRKIAAELESGLVAHVSHVGSGTRKMNKFAPALPPVILLDGDHESLSAELLRAVPVVHNRLWHVAPQVVRTKPWRLETVDSFGIEMGSSGDRYAVDPWLEFRDDQGELGIPDTFGPYWQTDWYRVRHSVLAAASLIEAEANRIAPSFVQAQGTIGIEVLPVAVWGASGHRVRATFAERGDDEPRDLRVVGAGTARWVAAAVRLACRRLETAEQTVVDETGAPVTAQDVKRGLIRKARSEALTQAAVRLEPTDAPGIYIADEPEAHLHPAAVRSVRDWLIQLAGSAATVLVATHSPALLDGTSPLVSRILVRRTGEGTELRLMNGALADELAAVSDDLGITKGELLLLTRLAVFVEGPHDQIVLDEWFGEELRSAGIRVYPVHGVDNLTGLAESEIVSAIGIRIATLSDDTSVRRVESGRVRTRGESAVVRLLNEAARTGLQIRPVGLGQPDMLYYLDKTVCQQAAPAFPGWPEAAAERAREASRDPWKRWVESRYGLSLSRDSVRDLARQCRDYGKIPSELRQIIQELLGYAAQDT
jgi:predicted ATPase